MSTHGQATWSTWTSRSWAASRQLGKHHSQADKAPARGNPGRHPRHGYGYLHAAVDDHSRLAYVELLGDERAQSCARFGRRAHRWFAVHGVSVHRVLTDNGVGYRSRVFRMTLADLGVRHRRTRPYRPQTNGKVERFNRTLLEEWAYRRLYRSNAARDRALQPWVHRYNHHRAHTALGGRPPISRVNNLPDYYT
jgi:transposase